jgi:CubicO group peptidase (beta-lactamase class C family)
MKIDADTAGMDAERLSRIDQHLIRRYLEPGKIAGCQVAIMRHGVLAHLSSMGYADRERTVHVSEETIWRIYSMTKPITGVALMSLYEQGLFQLTDPVSKFLPEWAGLKVREHSESGEARLVAPQRPVQIRDLLTHTSGIGYGRDNADVDVALVAEPGQPPTPRLDADLASMVTRLAGYPLRFHPGTHWLYSVGTDVCGRLVELLSGQRFDRFLADRVLGPLAMVDTGFWVPEAATERLAASYGRNARKELVLVEDPTESAYLTPPTFLSGGGGLVSTTADYLRFCQMLLAGGELDGRRVLGRKTVELMTINHLPGDGRLSDFTFDGGFGAVGFEGMGFGLTMAVSGDPAETGVIGSAGEFMWGGAASTTFWVDPAEELIVVFMTQLLPARTFDFRGQLKTLVYPAIVD